ncbi:MAG: DUF72 domain-containing protein, partial [Symploca sp. SIO2B6]|nr:DUF72 domain-containing protein [Symploca sp. SIO2B6]
SQFPRQTIPIAVEVRHIDWFKPDTALRLNHALTQLGVGRVLLDSRPIYECDDDPQRRSQRRKPRVPLQPITTAPFSLIRYISHPILDNNQRYLSEWVAHVSQWYAQGVNVYFFVHCPVEVRSPSIAQYFQTQLDNTGLNIPRLPWNDLEQNPTQLSLF